MKTETDITAISAALNFETKLTAQLRTDLAICKSANASNIAESARLADDLEKCNKHLADANRGSECNAKINMLFVRKNDQLRTENALLKDAARAAKNDHVYHPLGVTANNCPLCQSIVNLTKNGIEV